VRELQHVVERLVLLGRGETADLDELPASVRTAQADLGDLLTGSVMTLAEVERRYTAWALEQLGGHRARTAQALDISPKTLAAKLQSKLP
jgi:DNA-binding NtrC family response regulator